jgi:hypothetical protein
MGGMSPELETLDQLFGGAMPLSVIRRLYGDDESFERAIHSMLRSGDIRLDRESSQTISQREWRALFVDGGCLPST